MSKTFLTPNIQLFAEVDTDPNGGNAGQDGGNGPEKTYTQQELDNIVNERTGRATKSALSSFFKQKGLSEDEANAAIGEYLENKKKSTPDVAKLQSDISSANSARLQAEIEKNATIEAVKHGVSVNSIPYVLRMADFNGVTDDNGKVNSEKLSQAVKKVLDDIPALKGTNDDKENNGVRKIGGNGLSDRPNSSDTKPIVPTKRWNRFNN